MTRASYFSSFYYVYIFHNSISRSGMIDIESVTESRSLNPQIIHLKWQKTKTLNVHRLQPAYKPMLPFQCNSQHQSDKLADAAGGDEEEFRIWENGWRAYPEVFLLDIRALGFRKVKVWVNSNCLTYLGDEDYSNKKESGHEGFETVCKDHNI